MEEAPATAPEAPGRNAANYAPLTPLSFLERAAEVYPAKPAVIHGERWLVAN